MVSLDDEPDALQPARLPADLAPSDPEVTEAMAGQSAAPGAGDASVSAGAGEARAELDETPGGTQAPPSVEAPRPSFVFFGVVAALSLIADIGTKVWAELALNQRGFEPIELIDGNLSITLAYNRGGAWGLLAGANDAVRLPFFLGVSAAAILFIISLYARLHVQQRALKWGLPLVLGGALGNLSDRITRSQVIDFIDYRADWVMDVNSFVHQYAETWTRTDHWPTFNVADIAICIGVGLMAVDMFTHRPRPHRLEKSSGASEGVARTEGTPDASLGQGNPSDRAPEAAV